MGNFCMGDVGINGIADHKHEKPPTGPHFCPRALRALGQKWRPLGGFSCLWSAIPFIPTSPMQKLPISPRYVLPEPWFQVTQSVIIFVLRNSLEDIVTTIFVPCSSLVSIAC